MRNGRQITVADLTGVAVQDTQIANRAEATGFTRPGRCGVGDAQVSVTPPPLFVPPGCGLSLREGQASSAASKPPYSG